VNLDGPYGSPMIDIHDYEVLILVCGGVGITPLHSIMMHMFNMHQAYQDNSSDYDPLPIPKDQKHKLRKLYFVWYCRKTAMLSMMEQSFRRILESGGTDFELILCVTGEAKAQEMVGKQTLPFTSGRINLDAKFGEIKQTALKIKKDLSTGPARIASMVCGPQQLVDDVSNLCFKHDFDFHTETFAL